MVSEVSVRGLVGLRQKHCGKGRVKGNCSTHGDQETEHVGKSKRGRSRGQIQASWPTSSREALSPNGPCSYEIINELNK